MPRKKRTPAAETVDTSAVDAVQPTNPTPDESARTESDVFDQVIAARQAEQVRGEEPVPPSRPAEPLADAKAGEGKWQLQPDPHPFYSIALSDSNDGPRIHLYRSRRFNQVAVRFDEKPDEAVRQRMHDEGYRWRQAEGVWTKQLGEYRASGQLAAERLVDELANGIRAERGLAPVGQAVGV